MAPILAAGHQSVSSIFFPAPANRLCAPSGERTWERQLRAPRLAPMLAQIGAALLSQTVGHARLYTVFIWTRQGRRRSCARGAAWRQNIGGSSSLGAVPW